MRFYGIDNNTTLCIVVTPDHITVLKVVAMDKNCQYIMAIQKAFMKVTCTYNPDMSDTNL